MPFNVPRTDLDKKKLRTRNANSAGHVKLRYVEN